MKPRLFIKDMNCTGRWCGVSKSMKTEALPAFLFIYHDFYRHLERHLETTHISPKVRFFYTQEFGNDALIVVSTVSQELNKQFTQSMCVMY